MIEGVPRWYLFKGLTGSVWRHTLPFHQPGVVGALLKQWLQYTGLAGLQRAKGKITISQGEWCVVCHSVSLPRSRKQVLPKPDPGGVMDCIGYASGPPCYTYDCLIA
jgi:hypothetical protein